MVKAEVLTISLLKDFLEHSDRAIYTFQITQTIKELKEGIKAFIYKYNFKRFHSSLNYQKPMNIYLDFIQKTA